MIDIKPTNILFGRNGQVKIADFGVAGEFGTRWTVGTFTGTSFYVAPERLLGQSYTITSDVWSLGITILQVAQNRFPYFSRVSEPRDAGLMGLLTRIATGPAPKLEDELELKICWSEGFKYFIDCWYVEYYLLVRCIDQLQKFDAYILRSLEREAFKRATPMRMLEHPWMKDMKGRKVNMERFLREVWGWG